ncbi:stage III sporulation protein AE [Robinsoniella peoriensis]
MKKFWFVLTLVGLLFLGTSIVVQAEGKEGANEEELQESYLDELDLNEIESTLDNILGDTKFDFKDALGKLIKGDMPMTPSSILQIVKDAFFAELNQYKSTMLHIIMIVIAAAIFTNFTGVFEKSQIADISFYMMYLLLFTVLIKAFWDMSQLTMDTLGQVLNFMKVLLPAYFVAATFAAGSITAAGFYELTLVLITVIQWVLKYLLLPGVNLYVIFLLLNHLAKEDYLSKMAELLNLMISWVLKTLLGAVIGIQTVQCLIMPAVDSLKNTLLHKTSGAIPVIGNVFNAVSEVVVGSAVLVKNAVGVAGLIAVLIICLMPLVKLVIGTFMYKLLSAVIQPISDKRMIDCIGSIGDGAALLVRILFTAGALFLITLAMVTASIRGL